MTLAQSEQYHAITDLFNNLIWSKMVFYCKPFNKTGNQSSSNEYDDLINKPGYILKEKDRDREVMLNGQIKTSVDPVYDADNELVDEFKVKRTRVCLKALHVEPITLIDAIKSTQHISKPPLRIGKRTFD